MTKGRWSQALKALGELPQDLGRPQAMLADNGYFSGDNVEHCVDEEITPYIAVDREKHHVTIQERAAEPRAPERARRCGGTDEAPAEDHPGARPVRTAQSHGGTRVRHHQIGDGVFGSSCSGAGRRWKGNGRW